jgi:methyl-accepting chemotaxis protein
MKITVTPNKETVDSIGEQVEAVNGVLGAVADGLKNIQSLVAKLDQEVEVDPGEAILELVEEANSAVHSAIDAQNELVDNVSEAESGISNVTYSLEELASQLEKSADALDSIS